jgi:hypothetical protein
MTSKRALALAIFVTFVGVQSSSSQSLPMVHVGAGGQSCGEWITRATKPRQSDDDVLKEGMMLSWVQGYGFGHADAMTMVLSGPEPLTLEQGQARYHTLSGRVYDMPDAEATRHWLTKFCRENPLEPLTNAALGLASELFTKK